MRRLLAFAAVACLACGFFLARAADAVPDPLRLVPEQADIVFKLERPRALVEDVLALDLVKQLQGFEAFQELYDSTNARRFHQLVAYFEKELGGKWPDLLDRLAGGGAVLATKVGENNGPALFVVQSKDEALLHKFVKTTRSMIEQELARQEAKERIESSDYRKIETQNIGKDFHAAIAGSALVFSNRKEVLHAALDRHLDAGKPSLAQSASIAQARKLLPANPYAWMWLNVESLRKLPDSKAALDPDATEPIQTVLFGGWLDQFRRTPFLCGALAPSDKGFVLTFRTPVGHDGMNEGLAGFHLPVTDQGGTLPLLEPKGVLFSMSYILDFNQFWEKRAKVLNAEQVKGLEEFDRQSGKFLGGNKVSWLMTAAGAQQRFVATQPGKAGYKTKADQPVPAFAQVIAMRDPKTFGQGMETALRTAALGGLAAVKLKLVEEKHGDLTIVGWRFPEEEDALEVAVGDVRFNFAPCFVAVGNQFVISSTFELAHELVDILQKEARGEVKKGAPAMQMRFYPGGVADFLQGAEDQLLAATVLDRALAPKEAKEQVKKLIEVVRKSATLHIEEEYGAKDFRFDIKYAPGK
jgi:hypothetical protein